MRRSASIACACVLLLGLATPARSAEGVVRGAVVDQSGGVLPGVTVTATALDGRVLATEVTDAAGVYVIESLPPEPVTIAFQLEGFSPASVDVTPRREADTRVATMRLALAARSETVDVVGRAPSIAPPTPPRPVPPPPPPPPIVLAIPEHDRDSVCGPSKADAAIAALGTIRSRRYGEDRGLYTKDDQVIVEGGTLNGLAAGQNVVARRRFRTGGGAAAPVAEHTAGVLQIVAAGERASIAVVVYTCDEIARGDVLAAFIAEPLRAPDAEGAPAFDRAAAILFADAGQLVGAPRRLLVIDAGRNRALHAGQRLTLFRRSRFGAAPTVVGDAVVVAVRLDSATIRVERAIDVIGFGDYAAPQIPAASVAAGARR
jgi:hypothetical protein